MTEQKVYDLLELIEIRDGLYEEDVIRLLSFIYNDVYGKYDEKISEAESWQYRDTLSDNRSDIGSYLDEEDDSILFYLYEMISDNKTEFIEKFFSVCNRYFKIVDNKLYDREEFNPMSFTFNIYTFLKIYHESKEDFNYFDTMVDSFSSLIIKNKLFENSYDYDWDLYLSDKKEVLSLLISLNAFEKLPGLKEFCCLFLEKIAEGEHDDSELFNNYMEALENLRVYIPIIDSLKNHPMYKEENVTRFVEELIESCDLDLKIFFSPNYFLGDRWEHVKFKLDDTIENNDIANSIYERISELTIPMFDFLNEDSSEKDSFIESLDIIFDSDTFHELDSKLNSLTRACELFDCGEKEEALKLVRGLSGSKHKKIILDNSISYRDDLVNKADKPELIIDREKECIVGVFGTFNTDIESDIDSIYEESSSIDEFEDGVTSLIKGYVEEENKAKQAAQVNTIGINAYNFDEVQAPQKKIGFFNRRRN